VISRVWSNGTEHETLCRTAARLLEFERIIKADVQEVSANYDATTHSCPLFADFGHGSMRALGIVLPAERVEAGIRLLAAIEGRWSSRRTRSSIRCSEMVNDFRPRRLRHQMAQRYQSGRTGAR